MKRHLVGFSFALAVLALPHIASAQSLKEKLVGAYILAEGSEVFADGKTARTSRTATYSLR